MHALDLYKSIQYACQIKTLFTKTNSSNRLAVLNSEHLSPRLLHSNPDSMRLWLTIETIEKGCLDSRPLCLPVDQRIISSHIENFSLEC